MDVRLLTRALLRALPLILLVTLLLGGATFVGLNQLQPSFVGETKILIETGESGLTRAAGDRSDTQTLLDTEGVQSQVQLIRSRELARVVANKLGLAERAEFDTSLGGESTVAGILRSLGLARSGPAGSAEDRVLARYYDKLDVFAMDKTRVIVIDFSSHDPDLAAEAANTIAEQYIALQQNAKREVNSDAARWLESQIADLRVRVRDAEAKVEAFRASSDLLKTGVADAATTLTQQQLSELNTELGRVRAARTAAQAKADQIRAGLRSGAALTSPDVLASPLIQNLSGQQVTLRAQIAQLSATLLPAHPRIKELNAQLADLEGQIRLEANKILGGAEGEARLAESREAQILAQLNSLKTTAAQSSEAQVQLRALEREAASDRDLLETYLKQAREAVSRQNGNYVPADARIISRASAPIEPAFPKVVPMSAAATAAIFLLCCMLLVIRELVSGRPMRPILAAEVLPTMKSPPLFATEFSEPATAGAAAPAGEGSDVLHNVEQLLAAITAAIVKAKARRVLVTHVPVDAGDERPLAAVVIARALAQAGDRVLLLDLQSDGADRQAMMSGQGPGQGISELFLGEATFADVILRDRGSAAHFIAAGLKALPPSMIGSTRMGGLLTALDQSYDRVVVDISESNADPLAAGAGIVVLVTEAGATDPRTVWIHDRLRASCPGEVLLLLAEEAPARREAARAA